MDDLPFSSFGGTLTGGIQEISAVLPLLGTEQCEDHVASALTKGYLYAAATPISIFGSLGAAKAGFKTLIACIIPSQRLTGAHVLVNMGFKPQGSNLSLIMRDQDANSRYLVESRLDRMLKDLHIDDARKVKAHMKCIKWNFKMILVTALCCASSIVPYIRLSPRADGTVIFSQFRFPIIRALGGFFVATMMQLTIQNRILVIVTQSLMIKAINVDLKELGMNLPEEKRDSNLESEIQDIDRHIEQHCERYRKHIHDANNIKSKKPSKPVQWSIFPSCCNRRKRSSDIEKGKRMDTYSLRELFHVSSRSPKGQTGLEGTENSELVTEKTISNNQYEKLTELKNGLNMKDIYGKKQLVGLNHFWTIVCYALLLVGILASVIGYVGCFSVVQSSKTHNGPLIWLGLEATLSIIRFILWGLNPDCDDLPPFMLDFELDSPFLPTCNKLAEDIDKDKILPLVRAQEFLESVTAYAGRVERFEDPNLALYYAVAWKKSQKKSVLYIAIFDVAERTTRIYVQPTRNEDAFYSTAEHLEVDLEHAIVQIKMGNLINPVNDPVASNANIRTLLTKHYQSIQDEVDSLNNILLHQSQRNVDDIRNPWTFHTKDLVPKKVQDIETLQSLSDWDEQQYSDHEKLESLNRTLRKERMKKIDTYMELVNIDKMFNVAEQAWQEDWKAKKEGKGDSTKGMTRNNEQEDVVLKVESRKSQESVKCDEKNKIGLHETKIYAGGTEDGDPLGDVKKGIQEVKEILMVAERWMMEMILFREICGWEEQLLKYYKVMTSEIVKRMEKWMEKSVGERAKKILTVRWTGNAWIRLNEDKRAMEARWKDGLARKLLAQSVKPEYARSLIDRTGQWSLAFDLYVAQSAESTAFWDPRSILNDFLCQTNIEDKARKCGGKLMEKVVQDWCEGMKCRLRREIEEMEVRLDCDEFIISTLYSEQIKCSSKWLDTSKAHSVGHFSSILKIIKHRRQAILLIEFGRGSDDELAELIPTIHNMTSVTTVSLKYCREFGDKACAALVDVISKNRSIVSILGKEVNESEMYAHQKTSKILTAEIKDGLQRNIDFLGTRTAISIESGYISDQKITLCAGSGRSRKCFTLRFLAPIKGNLILRLHHNPSCSDALLKIEEVDSFRHEIHKNMENITLSPTIHFTPGKKTVLTFVVVFTSSGRWGTGDYNLFDIQLLDEGGNPYNNAQDESRISVTASNDPDPMENSDDNGKIVKRTVLSPQT